MFIKTMDEFLAQSSGRIKKVREVSASFTFGKWRRRPRTRRQGKAKGKGKGNEVTERVTRDIMGND